MASMAPGLLLNPAIFSLRAESAAAVLLREVGTSACLLARFVQLPTARPCFHPRRWRPQVPCHRTVPALHRPCPFLRRPEPAAAVFLQNDDQRQLPLDHVDSIESTARSARAWVGLASAQLALPALHLHRLGLGPW